MLRQKAGEGMLRPLKPYARASPGLARDVLPRPLSACPQSRTRTRRDAAEREETRVTDRASPVSGVAQRYASALFELARDGSELDSAERDIRTLSNLLDESSDLRRLVESPVFSAEEQERAIGAVASRAGIGGLVGNFVRLVAKNRRLFALPGMIRSFEELLARHRGEMTAEVTSAHPLSAEHTEALKAALKEKLGKDVAIRARVNPAILGGLIVKVGSRMIDNSLRTRLTTMKTRLKEVG